MSIYTVLYSPWYPARSALDTTLVPTSRLYTSQVLPLSCQNHAMFFQSPWIKPFISLPRGEPPHSHIHTKVLPPTKENPCSVQTIMLEKLPAVATNIENGI